ncbi:hypothetical protein KL86DYS1_31165 [uncultured Dysgonomonas sp.]|uniref:Uncharacterized protein n=1 Tax=uncultured Dysgonomonas sp. TaxID=206096 RepID=A0A212K1W0_9BACT|nr:hypothetical protein KL86DYS1_31165 [uncultured Dysgonomonas sp.]
MHKQLEETLFLEQEITLSNFEASNVLMNNLQ